jgi:hypothetical protein
MAGEMILGEGRETGSFEKWGEVSQPYLHIFLILTSITTTNVQGSEKGISFSRFR